LSPRIVDIVDTRLWRIPAESGPQLGYGKFDGLLGHTINLAAIRERWDGMLRVAGSLVTGKVRAYDLIRMMSADGRTAGLCAATVEYASSPVGRARRRNPSLTSHATTIRTQQLGGSHVLVSQEVGSRFWYGYGLFCWD
jgi:hypothetical protein